MTGTKVIITLIVRSGEKILLSLEGQAGNWQGLERIGQGIMN